MSIAILEDWFLRSQEVLYGKCTNIGTDYFSPLQAEKVLIGTTLLLTVCIQTGPSSAGEKRRIDGWTFTDRREKGSKEGRKGRME